MLLLTLQLIVGVEVLKLVGLCLLAEVALLMSLLHMKVKLCLPEEASIAKPAKPLHVKQGHWVANLSFQKLKRSVLPKAASTQTCKLGDP